LGTEALVQIKVNRTISLINDLKILRKRGADVAAFIDKFQEPTPTTAEATDYVEDSLAKEERPNVQPGIHSLVELAR
jgi:hypothetical protein